MSSDSETDAYSSDEEIPIVFTPTQREDNHERRRACRRVLKVQEGKSLIRWTPTFTISLRDCLQLRKDHLRDIKYIRYDFNHNRGYILWRDQWVENTPIKQRKYDPVVQGVSMDQNA